MREFRLTDRVYFSDTDAGGIAYHRSYLDWAEHGRTEMMRTLVPGHNQSRLAAGEGILNVVKSISIHYRMSAHLDDEIEVITTVREVRKFSFIRKASRAEIRKEEIPEAEEIIEGKKARITAQVESALSEEPQNEYLEIARKVLIGRDPEMAFASILGFIYRNELDITQYRKIEAIVPKAKKERGRKADAGKSSFEEEGTTRLFIARGRKDGLTKAMLANIIIEQSGVRDEDLSDIEVHDDCSFVSAPYSIAERILKSYEERTVKGKPIVTRAKQERYRKIARFFCAAKRQEVPIRYDVASVLDGEIEYFEGAFI